MEIEEGKKLVIRRDKVPLEALSRALWDAMRHRGEHVTLEITPVKLRCSASLDSHHDPHYTEVLWRTKS